MKDTHYFKSHPGSLSRDLASQLLFAAGTPPLSAASSKEAERSFWLTYP